MSKSVKTENSETSSLYCSHCGKELNAFTVRRYSSDWEGEIDFNICWCADCQQERYDALAAATSPSLAIFYCCLSFDVPFDIKAVPDFESVKDIWLAYLDNIRIKRLGEKDGEALGFLDGITDITKIFGANLAVGEFNKAIGVELSARNRQPGTKVQRDIWGTGNEKKPYNTDDYKELDRFYATYSERLSSVGGPDTQQENILRLCARLNLDMNKALAIGQVDKAQKLNKMIQDNLASENLRKKDEKPLDDLRIDSIVDALEKAGLTKNGKFAEPDEIFRLIFGKTPKYPYTVDAADQMINKIWNRMQANDGLPEDSIMPDKMRIEDNLHEFADKPNDTELENYRKMGLLKMPAKKAGKNQTSGGED